jgi:hypothetical protein
MKERKRVIARLVPAKPPVPGARPDFLARLKKIYRGWMWTKAKAVCYSLLFVN